MHKPQRAVAMGLVLIVSTAAAALASAPIGQSQLQRVDVSDQAQGIQVQITAQGPLAPKLSTLDSPSRVVVALPDTVMATPYSHIAVNSPQVKAIRIGSDGGTPPTTRVVIDCVQTCGYQQLPGSTNQVVLNVRANSQNSTVARREVAENKLPANTPVEEKRSLPDSSSAVPTTAEIAYFQKSAVAGKYNGPGGCAASSCHGSVQPKTTTRIYQNEYSIWIGQDKHARAFSVLRNPTSVRIGKILNIGPPDQAPKCLVCHSLYVPADQRAQTFELDDGVSCENCHGPASGWLGPHTTKDWPYAKSLELGMYDTRNLEKRAEKCLTCHLGTPEKFVDHEMIAAGHPDLTFELGVFTNAMPPHWKMPEQNDPWRQAQAWGVGQAVQLRESLNRLARRANGPVWPEYAELDCFACHHKLTAPEDSWRQERGYAGRRPGNPPWNESRVVVFRDLIEEINPGVVAEFNQEMTQLAGLMNQLNGNREQIAASANKAASLAEQLSRSIENQNYDQSLTLRLMRRVARDGGSIAFEGERSAEQATMTLDSLFRAYNQNAKPANATEVRAAIDGLFQQLQQDPSGYSAPRFAAQMQRVSEVLGR
ncbi:MAG TPA: multiheme c-type cytochrome [Terriglobales bacterium]|nr:multiheme c-type cytochrome [Terriglobales bacterium]